MATHDRDSARYGSMVASVMSEAVAGALRDGSPVVAAKTALRTLLERYDLLLA